MELESKPDANVVSNLEHNQIFQSTYKEMRKINSNKMHANGYLVSTQLERSYCPRTIGTSSKGGPH
jgi:hypothetical protein